MRGVLRGDLPAKHGLGKLRKLSLGDLPEHDWCGLVGSLLGLRGGSVRFVGRIGCVHLVRRRVVLGGRRWAVLELLCRHLPACLGVSIMRKVRRRNVLRLCRVFNADSLPLGELLLGRRVGDWGLRCRHVLINRCKRVLKLRCGYLPTKRVFRLLS